jgi:hypothetical protein
MTKIYKSNHIIHSNQNILFSPGTLVSSTNKTDRPDITVVEILLKVVLNTLALTHLVDSNFICYQYNGILPDSEEKT